jgi:hypothetical protein
MFKFIKRYSSCLKTVIVLVFSNGLLQSCCPQSIDDKTSVDENTMINIAKSRSCDCGESKSFDFCIKSIEPHFDKLPSQGQNQVALNFIIYSHLDGGNSLAFIHLIDPHHVQITNYLKQVQDLELKSKFGLNEKKIAIYRRNVDVYSTARDPREEW